MDLTRAITYLGIDLNDAAPQLGKPGLIGRSVDSVDVSTISIEQYMDKKSQNDGTDFQGVGNLYDGLRTIEVRGTLYDEDRHAFFTSLTLLRDVLDPVQAYRLFQSDEGFSPLAFSIPSDAGGPVISQYILARPNGLKYETNRDRQGTNAKVPGAEENVALGIPWSCMFIARDPRIYGTLHTVAFTGAGYAGNWTNAGDYPSLVDITLVVNGSAGSVHVLIGGADFTINVSAGTNPRTIYYRGRTKLLTVLDTAFSAVNEILRQDMLVFAVPNSDTQHPLIVPGVSPYTIAATGVTLLAGSQCVFTDAWA